MKLKLKKRCKQMLTGLLALSMLCGLLPQNSVSVSAATTAKTKVSSYGRLGNVDVGSKTKTRIPIPGIRIPVEKNMVTMQRLFVFMSMTVIGQKKDLFLVRHLSGRYQREILLKQI